MSSGLHIFSALSATHGLEGKYILRCPLNNAENSEMPYFYANRREKDIF
jgi:hypothetical protein